MAIRGAQPQQEAVSNGALQGDSPVDFALPLLIIQLCLVLLVTRSLAWLLKPLRQPRVVAEIVGGVLLGPSALGHFQAYTNKIFPERSITILDTVSSMGLLFFLFIVGLELDLNEIRTTGKRACLIAVAGIAVPFIGGVGVATLVKDTITKGVKFAPLVIFMGVPLSITAFPVLVRILAEHKLLTTEMGQVVLPAAAINDVCAWIFLSLGVALAGSNQKAATPAWVLLSGIAYVIFMLVITRPFMSWLGRRASRRERVNEAYVCIALVGVLISGFTTDAIGLHPLFGAFVFGLVIPKEGNFAEMLSEKIEDFVTVLMLPLFFASSGLKTDLATMNTARSFGFLVLLLAIAAGGKVSATWVVAVARGMNKRTAVAVGFLMNTKGLVELIILNIGKDLEVLNDEMFAILVLMCLLTTIITTPVVMALYDPALTPMAYTSKSLQEITLKEELSILACIHDSRTISPIINFLEIARGNRKRPNKAHILHLIELSQRPSSLMIAKKATKLSSPNFNGSDSKETRVDVIFEAFGPLSRVKVKARTVVSEFCNMHEDICRSAAEKQANFIALPFHKCHRGDGELEIIDPLLRNVNEKVLDHACCSVGIIINRGPDQLMSSGTVSRRIAVLFFGGMDDREALALGCRLTEHPGVTLTILRFLPGEDVDSAIIDLTSCHCETACVDMERERILDQELLDAIKKQQNGFNTLYEEQIINNAIEAVLSIAKMNKFNMFLVGRGRHGACSLIEALADTASLECLELGPIGAVLAGEGIAMEASVVVVQQHGSKLPEAASLLQQQQQQLVDGEMNAKSSTKKSSSHMQEQRQLGSQSYDDMEH